jgi:hypothetical protein
MTRARAEGRVVLVTGDAVLGAFVRQLQRALGAQHPEDK